MFLVLKLVFILYLKGKRQQNKDQQHDQRQTRLPKTGGDIHGPYCKPHHHRGNAEKASYKRLVVIFLGTSHSAAVTADYLLGGMTLLPLPREWKKMGAVGSAGERM